MEAKPTPELEKAVAAEIETEDRDFPTELLKDEDDTRSVSDDQEHT